MPGWAIWITPLALVLLLLAAWAAGLFRKDR